MTADAMLDQQHWPQSPRATRATALLAAASWLPVGDGEPELLALAERFARWIEGGEQSA